jgi:hypothetical protein
MKISLIDMKISKFYAKVVVSKLALSTPIIKELDINLNSVALGLFPEHRFYASTGDN